jgi:hypothetical protein
MTKRDRQFLRQGLRLLNSVAVCSVTDGMLRTCPDVRAWVPTTTVEVIFFRDLKVGEQELPCFDCLSVPFTQFANPKLEELRSGL